MENDAPKWLRARLRPRDYDLVQELSRLDLVEGELSDLLRDGLRLMLKRRRNNLGQTTNQARV